MQGFCFIEFFDMFKIPFVNCYLTRLPSFEKCQKSSRVVHNQESSS